MGRELANVIRILSAGQGDLESNPIYLELPKRQQLQTSKSAYKNIIVLSLESFERGYLHPSNHYITSHLQALKETWNYSDMRVTTGCAFTSASLYASMTGLPSLFPGHGNNYFYGATNYKLISLPAILANCGYETYFFSNNADFAGTKELLGALGVHHVLHGTFGGKYAESPYGGTYDKDLLNEAKQIAAQRTEQPYFMFIPNRSLERVLSFISNDRH